MSRRDGAEGEPYVEGKRRPLQAASAILVKDEGGFGMIVSTSRVLIGAMLCCIAIAPISAKPLEQVYSKPKPFKRGDYNDPYFGRQGGRICARWCLQDRNPCDPPSYKVADGRCYWENY